jgi:hypothetical protein
MSETEKIHWESKHEIDAKDKVSVKQQICYETRMGFCHCH